MTTPLERPLARELLLGGEPYKVVISPDGLRLTHKGHQKGIAVTWDNILALGQTAERPHANSPADRSDLPQAIAADVAREVRAANEALARVRTTLERAGTLPAALLADVEPDPVYGRPRHDSDWFVEPLLTIAEVASILRLSRNAVMRLPIRSISLDGERRYRQSEIRRYLSSQESSGRW
ncbi:MAG TPA: helix-turn-helix domain-containing protein [Gemmatimonadales bacterium]|nr:helix-turn-helix domain-containing protein [Gemmatimonadales bacterium]